MTRHAAPRMIRAANPSPMTLDGTRTYIVGRRAPAVIDPGPDDEAHLSAVAAAMEGAVPVAILLTHRHPDHAAGAARLSQWTGAAVRAAASPTTSAESHLHDGEIVTTDEGALRVLATPGHTTDHLALHWTGGAAPAAGAVFVGDLLMGEGDTTLVAHPEGDLRAYLASLDAVDRLAPAVLYPAHGPPIDDPAGAIGRYRAHRRERLDQVRSALAAVPDADPERLVTAIYGSDLDPRLRDAAAASVRAMLDYLRPT